MLRSRCQLSCVGSVRAKALGTVYECEGEICVGGELQLVKNLRLLNEGSDCGKVMCF